MLSCVYSVNESDRANSGEWETKSIRSKIGRPFSETFFYYCYFPIKQYSIYIQRKKYTTPLDILFLFVSMAKYFRNEMKTDQLAQKRESIG